MKNVLDELMDFLRENKIVPQFGLIAQGHIPTVQRMLSEGATWEEIGKAIGWHGETARQHYGWYLEANPDV